MSEQNVNSTTRVPSLRARPERIPDAAPYLFCELNREGRLCWVNAVAEAFFGYVFSDIVGHRIYALLHSDDRRLAREALRSARDASWHPVRLRSECANGSYRPTEWEFSYDERPDRVLAWGRDLTEAVAVRQEMESRIELLERLLATRTEQFAQALTALEDERRQRSDRGTDVQKRELDAGGSGLFDRILVGILRADPDQRIVEANPEALRLLDWPGPGGLRGATLRDDLFPLEEEFRELWKRLREDGVARGMPAHLRRPDGQIVRVRIDAVRARDGRGEHRCDELYVRLLAPVVARDNSASSRLPRSRRRPTESTLREPT